MQLHQAQFTAIQVKQEYPTQNQLGNPNSLSNDLKHQMVDQSHGQLQQMQLIEAPSVSPHHAPNSASLGNSTTTISTMSPLQAIPTAHADWGQNRLQLIQPSISNQGYLQHLYPPVIMSGNIIHSGIGQQPIQVIATSKPFSSGGPQMITAQNKQLLGTNPGNFSGSYTLPGIPSSQSQALVFSPVSVINSQPQQQQQNMLPTMNTQSNNGKSNQPEFQKSLQNQKMIQKVNNNNNIANTQNISGSNTNIHSTQQCVQVSQAMPTSQILSPIQQAGTQSMQITSPWVSGVPHFWTNGLQPQTLLTQNPIIIRGPQSDGTQGMFIQQATTHHAIQNQQQNQQTLMQCNIPQMSKPKMQIEPINKSHQPRAPLILPQNTTANRPASNVSTQTAQNQNLFAQKQIKRNKQQTVRPALTVMKSDSPVQIKAGMHQVAQQHSMHQVVTSGGNKMVVVSTGQPINIQSSGNIQQQNINSTDKQQIQLQQIKQHQQSLIHQQHLQQQIMQQNPINNQQLIQQQIAQQIHLQHQSQQHMHSGMQGGTFITQHQQQQNQFTTNQEQQRDLQQSGVLHQIVVQQSQQNLPQMSNVQNIATANTNIQSKHINIPVEKQKCNISCQQPLNNSNISILTSQTAAVSNIISSESLIGNPVTSTVPLPLTTNSNTIHAMTTFTTSVLPTTAISTGINSSTSHKLGNSKTLDTSIKPEPNISTEEDEKDKIESNSKKYDNLNKEEEKSESLTEKTKEEIKESAKSIIDEDKAKKADRDEKRVENETHVAINSEETLTRSCVKIKSIKNEKELPKAMIKPNVLTHVIEGFVIQEGSEPFSVTRVRYSEKDISEEPPNKKQALSESSLNSESNTTAICENCGKKELRSKLKKKRFCSTLCMRERKSFNDDDQNFDISNSSEAIVKPTESIEVSSQNLDKPKGDLEQHNIIVNTQEECPLMQWSVSDVCDFIKNLTGCNDYADDFAHQEIDGQALLLLKENHLVHAMGMKLGPALKIVAKVESMKEGNADKETH